MVASYKTINKVVEIVKQHVDPETFKDIINDIINKVKGNSSFDATIQRIYDKL